MSDEYYTTTDLMRKSGMSRMGLLKRCYRILGKTNRRYVLRKSRQGNMIRELVFTEDEVKKLELREVRGKKTAGKEYGGAPEEMKRLHPLVTDERFFRTSFFPDVDLEFR